MNETLEQVLIRAICDWGPVDESEVRLDHIDFLADRIRAHLAPREVSVTDEDAYRACKVGRITRDEPSEGEISRMKRQLESFAASLPVGSKEREHGSE